MLARHQHHVTSWADAGQSELNKPAQSVSWLRCSQAVTPCGPDLPSDLLFVCTGESDASWAGVDRGVTTGSPGVSCHGGERPLLPHSSSTLRVWFWFWFPKELRSRVLPLQAPLSPEVSARWSLKGSPVCGHGPLVRPLPQGEDPRNSGVKLSDSQPVTEEGAAPAGNPILLTNGPGHPHQLSCGR